ncbi:kinetochore protein NUF2 homolog [Oryza brachyantha]|uniref:Kinetochore protein Nuf2 N-terminal domain-containing protein n=1 Tax=Oryza brachyantha TaxID=4533 RepID=J3LUQ9_ORYBR|nr:kinetochore protein NUF2 homolog [Oryza brachyantha]
MSSNFSFPEMAPAKIAEELHAYGLAPGNLRAEDITNPQPDLLPAVFSNFLASVVDPTGDGDLDQQLGFNALASLDNPEHHAEAIRVLRLHRKSRAFLESIQFPGFTLRDFLRPDPRRAVQVLSALVNFLYYREEKLALLQPIIDEFPNSDERDMELKAKIAEHKKAIADHELAAQMEEPMVQQLEAKVNSLKQKLVEYNKQQLALRANANAIHEKKEETLRKISESDFELMKLVQENSKLSAKIVQSPEKLQRSLEERKATRVELKNAEKIAMQRVQEKTATLEIYSKASEKLSRHLSEMQALQEQVAAAKTLEKEVKARKSKISDESVTIKALDKRMVEWDGKVLEIEERAKAKEKERDQIIADENQKLAALRSEIEWKLKCLEPREREVEETTAKATKLCLETDSIRKSAAEEQQRIYAKFQEIGHAFNHYNDNVNTSLEQVEEVSKETLERLDRQALEALDTPASLPVEKDNSSHGPAS